MDVLLELCRQYFNTEDLYKVLKTHPKSTAKEVRKAYFELSLKYHPDKVPENEKKFATEKFKVINQVYSIINDVEKRKSYDATVASRQPKKQPTSWRPRENSTSWQAREQPTSWQTREQPTSWPPREQYFSWPPREQHISWPPREQYFSWPPREQTTSWPPREQSTSWQPREQRTWWQPRDQPTNESAFRFETFVSFDRNFVMMGDFNYFEDRNMRDKQELMRFITYTLQKYEDTRAEMYRKSESKM
ncbi:DnaJ domain [Cinara cedri]|uniref:DnaJ domain n=1 Tax=Cinara cedri TaxID=506608 RepID=A0A5E4N4N9_9HEMI|nr:DnaJ domain [Cinara cedri]